MSLGVERFGRTRLAGLSASKMVLRGLENGDVRLRKYWSEAKSGNLPKVSETSTVPVTRRHVLASSTLPFLVAFAGVRRAAGGSQDPVFQLTKS
ncbi:hypothetical protein EOA46_12460 [Mesorhizobium sp. M1A.F.Ca.IN.022.05.2.1]|uniref:hypothetical protein n=1 Tax=Mesorhizobium sp. M1A.F.Ca.IN.022.05.2.1 TaxID=2496760 RepID=UPI000FCAF7E4|nr:hypothetical protein [Mesorhizobium sp. M1A.F.Ca.IN.022.05.2.1]RUW11386.1 hypothetical protein EOA46_12460 [Mesorhizobium sp. M1A.F.Ca.IN.022.05.2.1]